MSRLASATGSVDFAPLRWQGLLGQATEVRVASVNYEAEVAARLSLLQELPGLAR